MVRLYRPLLPIILSNLALFAVTLLASTPLLAADAEGFDLEREAKSLRLKKHDLPNLKGGQYAAIKAQVGAEQARLLLPGLNVMRPVAITLQSAAPGTPLELQLVKTRWHKPIAQCRTDSNGRCTLKTRTHGDLGLVVVNASGSTATFVLDALIGPKLQLPPKRVAWVAPEDETAGGLPLWLVLGGGLVVAAIAALLWRRSQRSSAAVLLLAALLLPPDLARAEPVPGGPPLYPDELSFDQLMDELGQLGDASGELGERLQDLSQLSDIAEQMSGMFERLGQVAEGLGALQGLLDGYAALTDADAAFQPDLDERGLPDIPSMCPNNPACQQCFGTAHSKFVDERLLLEELRIIYDSTQTFASAALSFGDTVSGVHGVSGLAWQSERRKIEKSLTGMKEAYDRKYAELIDRTHEALLGISRCEDQFGMEDWYNRFGYIYFEFLRDKYKRN
ncbi:MAG: hypothetical protein ACK4E7_09880 [Permianibacter sp.]